MTWFDCWLESSVCQLTVVQLVFHKIAHWQQTVVAVTALHLEFFECRTWPDLWLLQILSGWIWKMFRTTKYITLTSHTATHTCLIKMPCLRCLHNFVEILTSYTSFIGPLLGADQFSPSSVRRPLDHSTRYLCIDLWSLGIATIYNHIEIILQTYRVTVVLIWSGSNLNRLLFICVCLQWISKYPASMKEEVIQRTNKK